MDFTEKVKRLKETTTSPEVRSLCENFLNNSFNRQDLIESLDQMRNQDGDLGNFLRESVDLHSEMRNREMEVSKRIANSLMESSWGSNRGSNAGTWVTPDRAAISENQNSLNESLSSVNSNDSKVNSFLVSESIKDLGVLRAIDKIKASPVNEHFKVKVLLENYRNVIVSKGAPEYSVIHNFIKDIEDLNWDNGVKKISESLKDAIVKFEREIEVSKLIDIIKNTGSRDFYSDLYESLNSWMLSEEKSSGLLVKEISRFSFVPQVRNLVNFLNVNESKSDKRKLAIPQVAQGESYVSKVYSPVCYNEGSFAFSIGGSIFEANDGGEVYKISENQAAEKFGSTFMNLLGILSESYVRADDSGVNFSIGKKILKVTEGENNQPNVFLGKTQLKFRNTSELGKLIGLEVSSVSGYNDMKVVNQVVTVFENINAIAELDFAKSIVSKIYEGLSINLFKWNDQLYLQKINTGMRENSIYSVNASQAVNIVKESLRYDISEGLTQFLDGELRNKSILLNDRSDILKNIQKVEEQIKKLEEALNNPVLANEGSLKEAHSLLKRELKVLRNKWSAVNEEIERMENGEIELDFDLFEDDQFSIGDYVKIKESGETGKIISVDNTSGRYTVLTDSGKTEDHRIDELQDLESALNKAAEENVEASDNEGDTEEEVKESNSSMSVAPTSGKKVKSANQQPNMSQAPANKKSVKRVKPQQPNLVEAPEHNTDKPMAKDLKNPKAANFAEGLDGQKPTKFDVKGYDIGYNNIQESTGDIRTSANFDKAPEKGKNAGETGKANVKDQNLATIKKLGRNLNPESKKIMGHIASKQGLSEAPNKHKSLIDFGVNDYIGYNIKESEEGEKKN